MTRDNDPAILAELARLDAAVREAPSDDTEPQIALWQAVAQLDRWFFIQRGTPEDPRPYGVAFDHGPMICLYSCAARAAEAARTLGLVEEGEEAPLFGVPMPEAIDYVEAFGQAGVTGVALDHPQIGHYIPLANLSLLKSWRAGAPADE